MEAVGNGEGAPFSTTPQPAPGGKDAKNETTVPRRVSAADGRAGAGQIAEELAKEFEPSAQAIRNWVRQADRDEGRREDGLTTAEREELRGCGENRRLKQKREILAKAAAWFARETDSIPPGSSSS